MKKSYLKLIIFDVIIAIFLILNSFILNILRNYYYMDIFLVGLLIVFKFLFGFEKDRHRFIKDIIINILIIYLVSFILYYILGIFIGFVRPENYLTFNGFKNLILPYIMMIILKEYLRYQMAIKSEKSKWLTIAVCVLFIMLDVANGTRIMSISGKYSTFLYFALTFLPIITNNIACMYIVKKVGYTPNMFWLFVANMYYIFLPIVPNSGLYIESLIRFLFPMVLMYNVYSFFIKREKNIPISYEKKSIYIDIPILAVLVFVLAYFISGYFRYYAIAVATGSMTPKIKVGDVVIVDQETQYQTLKEGEVIVYKYDNIIVVHRLVEIVKVGEDYYFYTKGDANNAKDNYIIYPNMIVGRAKFRIPYIGLPTVWINDLFN